MQDYIRNNWQDRWGPVAGELNPHLRSRLSITPRRDPGQPPLFLPDTPTPPENEGGAGAGTSADPGEDQATRKRGRTGSIAGTTSGKSPSQASPPPKRVTRSRGQNNISNEDISPPIKIGRPSRKSKKLKGKEVQAEKVEAAKTSMKIRTSHIVRLERFLALTPIFTGLPPTLPQIPANEQATGPSSTSRHLPNIISPPQITSTMSLPTPSAKQMLGSSGASMSRTRSMNLKSGSGAIVTSPAVLSANIQVPESGSRLSEKQTATASATSHAAFVLQGGLQGSAAKRTKPTPSNVIPSTPTLPSSQQRGDLAIGRGSISASEQRQQGPSGSIANTNAGNTTTSNNAVGRMSSTGKGSTSLPQTLSGSQTISQPDRSSNPSIALARQSTTAGRNAPAHSTVTQARTAGQSISSSTSHTSIHRPQAMPVAAAAAGVTQRSLPSAPTPADGIPQPSGSAQSSTSSTPAIRSAQVPTSAGASSLNLLSARTRTEPSSIDSLLSSNRASALERDSLRLPQPPPLFPTTLLANSTSTSSASHHQATGVRSPSHIDNIESIEVLEGVAHAKESEILDLQVREANINMQLDHAQRDYNRVQQRLKYLRLERQTRHPQQPASSSGLHLVETTEARSAEQLTPAAGNGRDDHSFGLPYLLMDYSSPNRMEGPSTNPDKK